MNAIESRRRGRIIVALAYAAALVVALPVGGIFYGRHPIWMAAAGDLAATVVVFLFSVGLKNSSVYDPYWSVAPLPIVFFWRECAEDPSWRPRQVLILALVALWGLRLTANWVLRWRGPADEDFRYQEIRRKTGFAYWPASLVSIHLMPTIWVFLGLLPLFPALTRPRSALGRLDLVAGVVTGLAIALEALSDWQLRAYLRSPHDPEGILQTGVWSLCRHPNYLGEILFWWGLFLFGVAARPVWAWTVAGPLAITLLFVFISVPWMDRHLASRHPAWTDWMKQKKALLPWPRRKWSR